MIYLVIYIYVCSFKAGPYCTEERLQNDVAKKITSKSGSSLSALIGGAVQRHVYDFVHRALLQVQLINVRLPRVRSEGLVLRVSRREVMQVLTRPRMTLPVDCCIGRSD